MMLQGIGDDKLKKAREEFIYRCEHDFYLEWFWSPYQEYCWINTWSSKYASIRKRDHQRSPVIP